VAQEHRKGKNKGPLPGKKMFLSKKRSIVFPQSEHARLSGVIASLWGNESYFRPPIDFKSFVLGVISHDHYFGEIDTHEIGNINEEAWIGLIKQKALKQRFSNTDAQIVTLLHIKRLVNQKTNPSSFLELSNEIEHSVDSLILKSKYNRADFEATDSITNFCDSIAFDFCHEQETQRSLTVFTNKKEDGVINYAISSAGEIKIDPWPFSVEGYQSFIMAYYKKGYPQLLDPLVVDYCLGRG